VCPLSFDISFMYVPTCMYVCRQVCTYVGMHFDTKFDSTCRLQNILVNLKIQNVPTHILIRTTRPNGVNQ
jgi:hypothetical protein